MMWSNPSRRTSVCRLGAVAALLVQACSAGSPPGSDSRTVVEEPEDEPTVMGEPPTMMPPELGPSTDPGTVFDPNGIGAGGDGPVPGTVRRGLLEKQVACDGEGRTTVSGTVYIPSGALPVYGAVVYVPDADLQPLPQGASCSCQISGHPIATALTDSAGRFVLENAPVGDDIPLVVQVGDWRREFNIGTVGACTDNVVADQTLRLPARQAEGDMPRIAVATGMADALECLVRKLGIDKSEFTIPSGGGMVQLFSSDGAATSEYADDWNGGDAFPTGEELWGSLEQLAAYDVVLLSCEAEDDFTANKTPEARQALHDYLNLGGRVFASHYQEVWFEQGPGELPNVAAFTENVKLEDISAQVTTSFPKGQALAEWLVNVGASDVLGEIPIRSAQHTIVQENLEYAQRWIATAEPESVQYISANTPLGAPEAEQCGRLVLSDIHVSPGDATDDISRAGIAFPDGCRSEGFSPQEAVLAFMLFDITACVVPDDQAPIIPPPIY
jgi:hypothetical protein